MFSLTLFSAICAYDYDNSSFYFFNKGCWFCFQCCWHIIAFVVVYFSSLETTELGWSCALIAAPMSFYFCCFLHMSFLHTFLPPLFSNKHLLISSPAWIFTVAYVTFMPRLALNYFRMCFLCALICLSCVAQVFWKENLSFLVLIKFKIQVFNSKTCIKVISVRLQLFSRGCHRLKISFTQSKINYNYRCLFVCNAIAL